MKVFKDIEFNHIQVWGGGRGGEMCAKRFFQFFPCSFYRGRNWPPKLPDS